MKNKFLTLIIKVIQFGIILFIVPIVYAFIRYNTFYAELSIPQYNFNTEEIIITREFNPFNEHISTGLSKDDLKDHSAEKLLRKKIKISFWDKHSWGPLAETLRIDKKGEFLFKIGQTKSGIEILIQALKDNRWEVRKHASEILSYLGNVDKIVIDALLLTLHDKDAEIRVQAANSLGRLGKKDKTIIDALLLPLKDEDYSVRWRTAESLGKTDKTVIDALLLTLKDGNANVRKQAAQSLGCPGKADKIVIDALHLALKDNDEYVQIEAAGSLVRLGKADKTVIDLLLQALKSNYYTKRKQAADSLGRLGKADKIVIDALLLALKDCNPSLRKQAAVSLGILWQNKSDKELLDYLQHPFSEYRTAAAHALAHKKSISPETREEINHLKDTDTPPWVRLGAWKAYELLPGGLLFASVYDI